MSKSAVVVSVLALGLSGYTAWATGVFCGSCARPGATAEPDEVAALSARIRALEERLAAGGAPALLGPSRSTPSADDGLAAAPKPFPASPPSAPATGPGSPAATIDALEKRLAALEETDKARTTALANGGPQVAMSMPTIYGSVDDAAKDLDLSPRQKDDFERATADAKREMDELKKIPDADGETWEQVEKEAFGTGEGGAMKLDLGKMFGFPSRKIPGRTETFGQAQARIHEAAKRRLRETLTPDQQKKFDKAHVDSLLGGSSGAMISFGFSTPASDDAGMK